MIAIERNKIAIVLDRDVPEVGRRESRYWKLVELACRTALFEAKISLPIPVELNPGIVFYTIKSENWPATWLQIDKAGGRVRPTQFEGIIHNAAAGYTAIKLGLIGPQIVLVEGDPMGAAIIQLLRKRSRLMLVCLAPTVEFAESYVLETTLYVL